MRTEGGVLVVGAGPVGLLLASELHRDGVDTIIIDRLARRSFFCKALGVTARTLEIFEELGIVESAIDNGVWLEGITVFSDGKLASTLEVPAQGLPYGSLSLAQFETEKLLEGALHRYGGAVAYGWALTGLTEETDGVIADLENAEGEQRRVHCRWLVGCDGAHSRVRAALGLDFAGGQYPQTFMLADVEVYWDLPRGQFYRFNVAASDGGITSLVAVPVHGSPHRYRLSTILPQQPAAETTDEEVPDLSRVIEVMMPLLPAGTRLAHLHWSSVYCVSHRIVPSYSRGRIFLAGDAAHIHPPVGGQGMNTGLQDAHNLAWKLALASRGFPSSAILGSYSTERHPVGLDVVEQTSRALDKVIAEGVMRPGMRETQLLVGYPDSPIVAGDTDVIPAGAPSPGGRAPDAGGLKRAFVGHRMRLRDLLGRGRHVLLGYVDAQGRDLDALAGTVASLKAMLGADAAAGFAISPAGQSRLSHEELPVVVDEAGTFVSAYGATPGMMWLIRPDGHIAWHSVSSSAEALMAFLKRILS